jgi:phospholipid/cholesterol/gamma-HCH transport system substrate-binding protein
LGVSQARRNITVGIFVLAGLFLGGVVIFLIGDERRLFAPEKTYNTSFDDVSGLKPGAPVRMGGIDVGHVTEVGYNKKDAKDTTIYVSFEVVTSEVGRIRKDSKARIGTKGLLGDKIIEITRGSETADSLPPNSYIDSEVAPDMFGNVSEVADKAKAVMTNLEKATEPLGNEQLHKDIRGSIASLNEILGFIAHGSGYAHKLLADPAEAERISRVVDNVDKATNELNLTLQETRSVVARVQTGPGFTHDMIYGDGPKEQIQQFGNAAQELALTLQGVRQNESLAHDLLYGGKGDTSQAIANINAMTGDVRAIIADIRAGKGTIGGLLVDPSIYEDVKTVLGNVQRNDVLRALVRYSIKQDEPKPQVEVAK